jgi:hypothetical protein
VLARREFHANDADYDSQHDVEDAERRVDELEQDDDVE